VGMKLVRRSSAVKSRHQWSSLGSMFAHRWGSNRVWRREGREVVCYGIVRSCIY
jgi:hypothetical protein